MREKIGEISLFVGIIMVLFAGFCITLAVGGLFVCIWNPFVVLTASFGLSMTMVLLFLSNLTRKNTLKIILFSGLIVLCIIFVSALLSSLFFDISYDGRRYHQEAIINLANGWNPIYSDFKDQNLGFIIDHYAAQGHWILAALIYQFTQNLESGKMFNILYIITSFCLLFSLLLQLRLMSWKKSLLISLLISLNPVTVAQMLTFYNDGQMSSLLIIQIALLGLYYLEDNPKRKFVLMMALATVMAILCNIKFTGLIYSGITMLFCIGALLLQKKYRNAFLCVLFCGVSFLYGILFIGYHPYVSNYIDQGNLFYPIMGSDYDIMSHRMPDEFLNQNRIEKILYSWFSASQNNQTLMPSLKFPLSISRSEWAALRATDLRIGGFGPLFGGLMVLVLIMVIMIWKLNKKSYSLTKPVLFFGLVLSIALWFELLITNGGWWARYAPQFYIFPVVVFVCSFVVNDIKPIKILRYLMAVVFFLNIVPVVLVNVKYRIESTYKINRFIDELKQTKNKKILVEFPTFRSDRIRLSEAGISFQETSELDCKNLKFIPGSDTKICIQEP